MMMKREQYGEMEQTARWRVENTPELAEYSDVILADWPEGEEHWQWVVTASVSEILEWVEAGRQ